MPKEHQKGASVSKGKKGKSGERRVRRWFIEPLNDHTHVKTGNYLNSFPERNLSCDEEKRTTEGNPIRVWECSEKQRKYLVNSRTQAHLIFTIWTSLDSDKLKEWPIDSERIKAIRNVRRKAQRQKSKNLSKPSESAQ
ncbi:MAG: hypothetical protein M3Q24_02605 [bacterium]|nr:hypothetical protein [bacterium]